MTGTLVSQCSPGRERHARTRKCESVHASVDTRRIFNPCVSRAFVFVASQLAISARDSDDNDSGITRALLLLLPVSCVIVVY